MKKSKPLNSSLKPAFNCIIAGLFFSACSSSTLPSNFSEEDIKQLRRNFQVTENIISELELIHEKTKTRTRPIKLAITSRQPRHVWHKAKSIHMSIQNLRTHKGLEARREPQTITEKIVPTDVYNLLNETLVCLRELRAPYNVKAHPAPAALPRKALPQDVYQNLYRINQMILGIESRTVTPTHVYRIANKTIVILRQIRRHEGVAKPVAVLQPSEGKHPRDVYKQAHLLHFKLKEFAEKQGYLIAGGVELLEKKMSRIIPNDVLDVLINVLADAEALRSLKGIAPNPDSPVPSDKTPSKVFDMVSEGIAILETME